MIPARRIRRSLLPLLGLALAALWLAPAAAQASFGFLPGSAGFEMTAMAEGGGSPSSAAGTHPYSLVTKVGLNLAGEYSDGDLRDLHIDLPPGLIENPTVLPRCTPGQFSTPRVSPFEADNLSGESCPDTTQIGIVTVRSHYNGGETRTFGVYNLFPPPGFPSRFGFAPYGVPVTITPHVREANREYGLTLDLKNFSQQLDITGFEMTIWGVPWAAAHNTMRGNCLNATEPAFAFAKCSVSKLNPPHGPQAYLTMPTSCEGPLTYHASATSWQQPATVTASSTTGGALTGCGSLSFKPTAQAQLSTNRTTSPTGYDFTLDGNSVSLVDPSASVSSQVRKAVVRLPEGMSVNPSVASGLGTCSRAQFAAETLNSAPGAGCPNASKIGELTIDSPLVEGPIEGSMFFTTPYDNPFGELLALYMVAKKPERGIMVKVAGRVTSDAATGRITATFDDLPQLPYSHFNVHFRSGQRSALASPYSCGGYTTEIDTTPWQDPNAVLHQVSPFTLTAGVGGGACPQGLAPFTPGISGGTLNANASSYSPLYLHLTRTDPDQEITSYSATFPRGLLAKVAGVPFCPEPLIEAAKRQTGAESATTPACPAASLIGRTFTGYGLGSSLAYAPGTLYLAGPYNGSPLSVVAIDSAKVGPFDLGTVVIRSAIRVDRRTAQVSLDSAGSDPIPHILAGFPLRLRDIRIYIDRPKFMINPTSCAPFALSSTLTGAGGRFSDSSDDTSATVSSPFQLSNCSALGFAPRFKLSLKGGHKRGEFPSLKATVRPRPGDSNIGKANVTLPPKLFLAQEHLDTVCTLRQFAAHNCPKGSIYGRASALTPLMDEPLTGNVYLRANGNERALPDLVAALNGRGVEVDVVGYIDSFKQGLRARFDVLPDAPVTKFTMSLRGGEKGIIANATNTCVNPQTAIAKFTGHDNGTEALRVPIEVKCGGKKGGK
jgi:hypothetical protein